MRRLCAQVNTIRLGDRLSRMWGTRVTPNEVRRWLIDHGFTSSGGSQWFCDEERIECLLPSEIIRQVLLETEGGVTFVTPPSPSPTPPTE